MFETKYKEACENMKLCDSFKTGLVNMMKKESKKAAPKKRLVLTTITAVILVSTSVVFATNYATNGQLFKNVLSGFGYDPQTTKSSMTAATETTGAPTATPAAAATVTPTITPTTTPTAAVTPTVTPTVTPSVTPTGVSTGRIAPTVSAAAGANSVTVSWTKITSPDLVGYKVVASKSDSTPKYSENGYYKWITNAGTTSCTISNGDGYNSGDVGTFSGGTSYYFSVTAIYGDEWQKIPGNAVQVTMPGTAPTEPTEPTVPTETTAPTCQAAGNITAAAEAGGVRVSWTPITDATGFSFYKIVAAISNSSPAYPGDGYYTYICDSSASSCLVGSGNADYGLSYYAGSEGFSALTHGQAYYFSVTTVYGNTKVAGTAQQAVMP